MAEERRQNIFVTLATDGVVLRKHSYDQIVAYPLDEGCITLKDGFYPNDIKIELGRNVLTLEDCDKCVTELSACFKSIGCKMTSDMDLQYCSMSIDGGPEETLIECMLSFVVKG